MKKSLGLALTALLLAFASGCTQAINQAEKLIATSAPAIFDDATIAAKIEARFVGIDADSALHVAVDAHDGNVRLSGRAKSAAIAARFADAAKAVPGVKGVDSQIAVDPKLPSATNQAKDFSLEAGVTAALIGQAGINAFSVKPSAHAGIVTLTGTVKSDALKATMLTTAKGAPGVKGVVDKIQVKP
jgi:osmotically-inducible protein OsmY